MTPAERFLNKGIDSMPAIKERATTSAQTKRGFRAAAMDTWRAAVAVA